MSTESAVAFGAVSALLTALVSALGLTSVALATGGVVTGVALALLVTSPAYDEPEEARRAANAPRILVGVGALPAVAAIAGVMVVRIFDLWEIEGADLWAWRGMGVVGCAAASMLFVSSMVDWGYIWPRLHGLGGTPLPCQAGKGEWEGITRIWLLHRMAAYVVGRVCALAAAAFLIASFHPRLSREAASALATLAAALLVFYLNRVVPIGALVTNPPMHVGDRVVLAEEYGTGVTRRPAYYVVDVAIEGVKLLELGTNGLPLSKLDITHDRSVALADVSRLLRARSRFDGCGAFCCGASKYCPRKRSAVLDATDEA